MVNAKEFWMKEGEKKGIKKAEKRAENKYIKQERQKVIDIVLEAMRERNCSQEEMIEKLQTHFKLSRREAMRQAKKAMV